MGEGLLAGGDLARILRLGQLLEQLADPRAGRDPEVGRQLVAAHERLRRPLGAPAQGVPSIASRDRQMRVDRLLRVIPARGQPVGDRQQRHVHLDRIARVR